MNRLLTILLLLGATAHGQIDNPPTPSSIGLGWSALTNPQSSLYSGTATKLLGYVAETNPSGSGLTGFNVMAYTNTNTLVIPANLLIGGDAVPAPRNPHNVTVQGAVTIQYPYSSPTTIYGNNSITATDDSTYTNTLATWNSNTVTFSTNVTASGTLAVTGDTVLSGVNNTMPGATTADSASSLMTRDLVGKEFANPRNRIQTTYWFGLEGLGEWSLIGSGALSGYVSPVPGLSGGRSWYSSHAVGTNHAGAGLRLGNDGIFGSTGIYRFSDGGALTMRGRIRNHDTIGVPALAFIMGDRLATQMWQQNAYGLYFVPQPTNVWASNAVATQHDRISVSNVVWAINTTGTNGPTEPTWTDLIGSLVTNGSAVYRNLGPHTSNNWVLGIGSTNASQVVMTNTGKTGLPRNARHEVVLKLRIDGTTNTPYTVYGTVENNTGESTEVSLTTTNNDTRQPQFWNRTDDLGTRTNSVYGLFIKYFSIDGTLNPL